MGIFGDQSRFAVEWRRSARSTDVEYFRAFGLMRYWVGGRAFGLDAEDATCIGSVVDDAKRRIAARGSERWPGLRDESGLVILRALFEAQYCETREFEEWRSRRRLWDDLDLHMPGVGSELFDDGSRVLLIELDTCDARMLAGIVTPKVNRDALDTTPHQIRAVASDVILPADEVFGVLSGWVAAIRREFGGN